MSRELIFFYEQGGIDNIVDFVLFLYINCIKPINFNFLENHGLGQKKK